MGKFIKLVSISLQSRMYYKSGLYMSLLSPIVLLMGQYLLWGSLYGVDGATSIGGLTKEYMFSYILLSFATNYLLVWSTETQLSREIISGTIVARCIRPAYFLTQNLSEIVGSMIPFGISNSVIVIIGLTVFAPFMLVPSIINWLWFIPCFLLSIILRVMFIEVFSLLCFYTTSHNGLSWTRRAIYDFFSGALIPIALFPPILKTISDFTPFPYMINAPISVLLGDIASINIGMILIVQIIWITVLLILHYVFFAKISKNLTIAGG